MQLFIDTADVAQIREAWSWGVVDGVTTNPTHVAKTGRPFMKVYEEILEIVAEGKKLAALHPNVVVKVPLMREGLKAVKLLAKEGIKTNVTVTFSAAQAMLAAKVGATYISPFVGRLDLVGHRGGDLVRDIKTVYTNYGFPTQILAAAMRHPMHVHEAMLAGADVATMPFDILEMLFQHPMTTAGIDAFLADWAKVPK